MKTWITICDTCKREDWNADTASQTDGEVLAEKIEAQAGAFPELQTRRVSCMMGCSHGCNIAIQSEGKLAYTLGRFTPDDDAATAILEYAAMHADSPSGQVPFRQWPLAIKGHFITRHAPLPQDD